MCESILDGGRRCTKHADEIAVTVKEFEQMTEEQKMAIHEPQRLEYERRITGRRARAAIKAQATADARAAREAAREEEAAISDRDILTDSEISAAAKRGENKAKSFDLQGKKRVPVHVRKNALPAGGAAEVKEAVLAEPHVSDDSLEEVVRKSNKEKALAEEAIAAERATIRSPRERAGRHRATPDDDSAEVKVEPTFTDEEARELEISAGVHGLSTNAYAARQVSNTRKSRAMRKDIRGVNPTSSADAIKGREAWQEIPVEERRELVTEIVTTKARLEREQQLSAHLTKRTARMAELKTRQQSLAEWQRAKHPDGGYGPQRISLKALQMEKHTIAAELTTLREGDAALHAEHKALVATRAETLAEQKRLKQRIFNFIVAAHAVGSAVKRGNHANAFMATMRWSMKEEAAAKPVRQKVSA